MSDERIVVIGRRVLTPEGLLASRAVEVRARRIFRVAPVSERDRSLPVAAEADIVAPGFIDIQINGAADRLLSDDPSVATMAAMAGAARKGGTSPVTGVVDYPEPVRTSGLCLVCTPGNDVESTTALGGAGVNVMLFSTGLGTPTGNPVYPVIKVSTNTDLATRLP
ncbi:MAG: hypothetical protein ABWZ80_05450, partial [Beijerinckiaceae bacterium]